MNFASDNITGVAPQIMARIVAENIGECLPYGDDDYTASVGELFSEAFEADVGVMLVSTGTASNALALACMCPPYGAIFCRRESHIESEEGGSVEHLSGGGKLVAIDGKDGKLTAEALDAAVSAYSPAAYFYRPAAVSITQVSELGTVYSVAEIQAISGVCRKHGLKHHIDGARFANAVAAQGCSLAEMSWKAGVDVLSFGATKNGAMAAEAVVFFDKSLMVGAAERRKRAGMLWSKHRFLAVQWQAYLQDSLWRRLAGTANERAQALAKELRSLGVEFAYPPDANELFVRLPESTLAALEAEGFQFYRYGNGVIRLVMSFATTEEMVDQFATAVRRHLDQEAPPGARSRGVTAAIASSILSVALEKCLQIFENSRSATDL